MSCGVRSSSITLHSHLQGGSEQTGHCNRTVSGMFPQITYYLLPVRCNEIQALQIRYPVHTQTDSHSAGATCGPADARLLGGCAISGSGSTTQVPRKQ